MSTEFTVDSIPYAPPHVVCKEGTPGLYLLLDPDTPHWVIVEDIGKDLVFLCDGKKTLDEIIITLCKKYGEPYEESVEGVLEFANELKKKQFIQDEEFLPYIPPDKKNAPFQSLWISVTNHCNLRCKHCHLSSGLPLENELTTEEICRLIQEAAELGASKLVITGGEPLLRKDILRILEYGSQNIEKVTFITNGVLITEKMAKKLKEVNITIQVSLDGARQETHDFIRGEGSYKKTVSGLMNLVKAGVQPCISMTILKNNVNEIPEMANLTKKLGIKYLHFPILQIKGRAKENEALVALKNEELVAAMMKILEIPKPGDLQISIEKNVRGKIERMQRVDFCEAGCSMVSVAADGKVYPCNGLHVDEFYAGTIREQPLKDIWKESEVFKRFRLFSLVDIPECRTCDMKFFCGCGCHVDRYFACGRLDVPTPLCEVQKKIYWGLLSEKMKEVQENL